MTEKREKGVKRVPLPDRVLAREEEQEILSLHSEKWEGTILKF